jgi:hypothetical protein
MTSWKWLFALIAVFTVLGLRTSGGRRAQLWTVAIVTIVLAYETLKYHAY